MHKVRLISASQAKVLEKEGKHIVESLYNGKSAVVDFSGQNDGVYYVKNFPKDDIYIISKTDTKSHIIQKGFLVEDKDIYPYNVIIRKKDISSTYTVKPLDNIESICKKLSLKDEDLIKLNNLKTKKLFVGQRLIVDI